MGKIGKMFYSVRAIHSVMVSYRRSSTVLLHVQWIQISLNFLIYQERKATLSGTVRNCKELMLLPFWSLPVIHPRFFLVSFFFSFPLQSLHSPVYQMIAFVTENCGLEKQFTP